MRNKNSRTTPSSGLITMLCAAHSSLGDDHFLEQANPKEGISLEAMAIRLEAMMATRLEAIAIRLEAIATRLEAMAIRLEAMATRLEAMATRLEAIAIRLEAIAIRLAAIAVAIAELCTKSSKSQRVWPFEREKNTCMAMRKGHER